MKDLETIYPKVIGYILKLIKNDKDISEYSDIFNCIKHTNYDKFIKLVKEKLNFDDNNIFKGIVYSSGHIKTDGFSTESGDCDFVMLSQSGPYMIKFYKEIYKKFGFIEDEINDDVYGKLALFELCIRMHVSNKCGNTQNDTLENVINKLCKLHNFKEGEKELLQIGRKFLNNIKHKRPIDMQKLSQFNDAYDFLCSKKITLF